MPFKSKAQVRKFYAMRKRGEISEATLQKWKKHTKAKYSSLPERVLGRKRRATRRKLIQRYKRKQ